jgi:hypothetical protein
MGFNAIRLITKMIHMQKKQLGLKLTGDQMMEKHVDRNNIKQIQQYATKYEYKI